MGLPDAAGVESLSHKAFRREGTVQDTTNEPCIEFSEPTPQPRRAGFNPCAVGYRRAALQRRLVLIAVGVTAAVVSGGLLVVGRLSLMHALLGMGLPLVLAAAVEWFWRHTGFCNHCGARTKSPVPETHLIWCPACQDLIDSAAIVMGSVGQFDLTGPDYVNHKDPMVQCLWQTILLACTDNATELRFEPGEGTYDVRVVVDGQAYDLVPPPSWIAFPIAQTMKAIAGLDLTLCDKRQEGRLDILPGWQHIATDVIIEPTPFGPKVVLLFRNNNIVELHAAAQARLAKIDADLKAEIARRPPGLRLPGKGSRFRALRDVDIEVCVNFRTGDDSVVPIHIERVVVPRGEILRLDCEPDTSESTHCIVTPERYDQLESAFVDPKFRKDSDYSGYSLSVSYVQLDADFEWLDEPAQ